MRKFIFLLSFMSLSLFALLSTPSKANAQFCRGNQTLCGGLCYSYDACGYGSQFYCQDNVAKCWTYLCSAGSTLCNGACWPNYQGYTLNCPNYVLTSCPAYNTPASWTYLCGNGCWDVSSCTYGFGCNGSSAYCNPPPPPPPPTITSFYADPNPVVTGNHTFFHYSSSANTRDCWLWGAGFSGWVGTSGMQLVSITRSDLYQLQCFGYDNRPSSISSIYVTYQQRRGLNAAIQTCSNGNWITTGAACTAQSSCTQIVSCVPNCAGKTCGSDGCGGSCGVCPSPLTCGASGTCVCTPTTSCIAQRRTCGTINDGCSVVTCGGPCAVCGNSVCEAGETAASCPADCGNTVSGTVYTDTAGNNCASGATAYSGGATVTLYTGASSSGAGVSNGSGVYSARSTVPSGQRTAVISNVPSYTVNAVRYQGGAWGATSLSGYTYGPFTHNSNQTLDWCLTNIKPWYQVDKGDVRRVSLANKVPSGQYLSTDVNYPGVPISSAWSTDLGLGQASAKNWKVDDEYSYNKNSSNKNGSVAYSYYKNRAASTSKTIASIPGCANGGSASCSLSNLTSGLYEFDGGGTGTLTITGYTHRAGAHVTLLINGNVTIASNISIPEGAGNLLVLAAKGNVTIDKSVGQGSVSSVTTNIDGIYSAEGKITIDGDTCPSGTPDRRLNVGGVLIANSKKPFTTGGSGIIDNKRSLCTTNDATYPSLYVKSRLDFLFQLTDFYLVPTGRYSQVQP